MVYTFTRDAFKVLKLHSSTARLIWRPSKHFSYPQITKCIGVHTISYIKLHELQQARRFSTYELCFVIRLFPRTSEFEGALVKMVPTNAWDPQSGWEMTLQQPRSMMLKPK